MWDGGGIKVEISIPIFFAPSWLKRNSVNREDAKDAKKCKEN
jgi:hypothetical protein